MTFKKKANKSTTPFAFYCLIRAGHVWSLWERRFQRRHTTQKKNRVRVMSGDQAKAAATTPRGQ
jgi:hypothetical protein